MVCLECIGMVRLPSGGWNRMQSVFGGADRGLGLSVTVAAMPDVIGQRLGHVADKLASREHGDGFHVAVVLSVDVAHQVVPNPPLPVVRSEEHTSELQSTMSNSYDVFWLQQTQTTQH